MTWRGKEVVRFLEDCPDVLIKSMGVGSSVPRIPMSFFVTNDIYAGQFNFF
jgi:hypothetical protein